MSTSKLMKVTYYDPKSQIRLLCYADTVVWDTKPTPTLTALRFGGYPERVQGLADAIYGGATIEIEDGKDTYSLKTLTRQYRRELSHDGVYAEAKLTRAWDLLALAAFIRETVRKSPSSPSGDFRSRLGETERLSTQDFAELSMARFRNDPHVNGAFQVDFPSGRFSFVMPGEGWRSYALKDISAAIYKAGRKSGLSKLERLHRFFDALTDKLYFTSEVEWNGGSGDV